MGLDLMELLTPGTAQSRAKEEREASLAQGLTQLQGGGPVMPFADQTPQGQASTITALEGGGQTGARLAQQQMDALTMTGGQIGNPSPKDFTIQSLNQYQQTGDVSELVRFTDPLAMRRANQADDRLAMAQLTQSRPAPAMMEKIIGDQISLDTLDGVIQRSDPSYFGNKFEAIADAKRWMGDRFGNEQAEQFTMFWREYDMWVTELRKRMFGSQFTPTEERVFNRLVANPSMSHTAAAKSMQQQRDMVQRARMRRSSVLEEFGYSVPERAGIGGPTESVDIDLR